MSAKSIDQATYQQIVQIFQPVDQLAGISVNRSYHISTLQSTSPANLPIKIFAN
jgi:hypothetical protein